MTPSSKHPPPIEQEPAAISAPPASEQNYIKGRNSAWRRILWLCLHELNICKEPHDEPLRELARVGGLLEDVRAALRRLCSDKGIEFDEELCLEDIVEKYIGPRVEAQGGGE